MYNEKDGKTIELPHLLWLSVNSVVHYSVKRTYQDEYIVLWERDTSTYLREVYLCEVLSE